MLRVLDDSLRRGTMTLVGQNLFVNYYRIDHLFESLGHWATGLFPSP